MNKFRILIVGGYGVFGGRLARMLIGDNKHDVLVAGRTLDKAKTFCAEHEGLPTHFDRNGDLEDQLKALSPDIVIDASGPFQSFSEDPYCLAQASIDAGAHYLDLADDTAFVCDIGALDQAARSIGVTVLSGASSVPAISSALADTLCEGLHYIGLIETIITPGNRAPRGLSIMKAILGQVGRPFRIWRGGQWTETHTWKTLKTFRLSLPSIEPLNTRVASPINVPDLEIFPERYQARSVLFNAGLELKIMHYGLWMLGWFVRHTPLRGLTPLTRFLKWVADRLEPFGTDRGGMQVEVRGRDGTGRAVKRTWTLIVEGGDGPNIPSLPAYLMTQKIITEDIKPGARPCLGEFILSEIEQTLQTLDAYTGRQQEHIPPLFEQALGSARFADLPAPVRQVHDVFEADTFAGEASVHRGENILSRIICWINGFPPTQDKTSVQVRIEVTPKGERWTRQFGSSSFTSTMSRRTKDKENQIWECFGPIAFQLNLEIVDGTIALPVVAGKFLGIPLPKWLNAISNAREYVDDQGRFCFDVEILLPFIGRLIHYHGWLVRI